MNNQNPKLDLIRNQILTIIFRHLDKSKIKVYLFGSRAENKNGKYSDIDIGLIYDDGEIPSDAYNNIVEDVNNQVDTLLKIDVVDFHRVDNDFRNFALKDALLWYTPKNI